METEKQHIAISRKSPRRLKKPQKSQIPFALIITIFVILFGYYLSTKNIRLPIYWIFGLAFGVILQRSRFCFTAAFRDPCITGSTSLTQAVLIAIALASIGFIAIKYSYILTGSSINMSGVNPIGIPLVIGAVLFGIGMVISGGCASGTVMRVGEGFTMQLISLLFFVIGSLWGAHDRSFFWDYLNEGAPNIFLPDIFGWFGAIVVQFFIILLLYIASIKWQKKKLENN